MLKKCRYRDLVRRTTERRVEFWWENPTKIGCSNNLGVDVTRILKWNFKWPGYKAVDSIHTHQDRDKWWACVETVMNIRILYNEGNFLTSWGTVSLTRSIALHWTYLFVCLLTRLASTRAHCLLHLGHEEQTKQLKFLKETLELRFQVFLV